MIEIDLSLTLVAAFVIGVNLVVLNMMLASDKPGTLFHHIFFTVGWAAALGCMAAVVYVEGVKAGVARTCVVEHGYEAGLDVGTEQLRTVLGESKQHD